MPRPDRRPWSRRTFLRLAGLSVLLAGCGTSQAAVQPSPTAPPSATFSPTRTLTPTVTNTATATATATATNTPTASASPTPTSTPTRAPTRTPTPTPTRGPLRVISLVHGPARTLVVDHVLQRFDVQPTMIRVDLEEPVPDLREYDAVIFAGGEYRPDEFDDPIFQAERVRVMEALDADVPILGICLGHQLLAHWLGGKVARGRWEIGWLPIETNEAGQADPLLAGLGETFYAFLWHGDRITKLPDEAVLLASTGRCPVQAYRLQGKPVWGVQFNPQYDPVIAENLVRNTPWLATSGWNVEKIIETGHREYDDLAGRIFGNFLRIVREGEGAYATPQRPGLPDHRPEHLEPR